MGLPALVFISATMFITSFAVGCLPLSFAFSRASFHSHSHTHSSALPTASTPLCHKNHLDVHADEEPATDQHLRALSTYGMGLLMGSAMAVIIPEGIETLYSALSTSPASSGALSPERTIALSLLTGFSLMLIIEQLSSSPSLQRALSQRPRGYELSNHSEESFPPQPYPSTPQSPSISVAHSKSLAATVALVIHSFADGVALGSSSLGSDGALQMVVFIAIMVHKAPAALGLCTTLLSHSEPRTRIRTYLFVFSAAAPVGAFITYFLVSALTGSVAAEMQWWAAVALLFSGGTFLYVATVIQDVSGHSHMPDAESGGTSVEEMQVGTRLALLVVGMFTPLLLGAIADHGHT